jgi:hypothetical protein
MKITFVSLGLVIVAVVVLVIYVTVSPPPPASNACVLARRVILPDICTGTCGMQPTECPPATTRPYAIIGTQAATCPDALICLP